MPDTVTILWGVINLVRKFVILRLLRVLVRGERTREEDQQNMFPVSAWGEGEGQTCDRHSHVPRCHVLPTQKSLENCKLAGTGFMASIQPNKAMHA